MRRMSFAYGREKFLPLVLITFVGVLVTKDISGSLGTDPASVGVLSEYAPILEEFPMRSIPSPIKARLRRLGGISSHYRIPRP